MLIQALFQAPIQALVQARFQARILLHNRTTKLVKMSVKSLVDHSVKNSDKIMVQKYEATKQQTRKKELTFQHVFFLASFGMLLAEADTGTDYWQKHWPYRLKMRWKHLVLKGAQKRNPRPEPINQASAS